MSKTIPLTQGKVAIVDDWNYDWLNQWKWTCDNRGYIKRTHLGYFDTKEEAAIAYNEAALKHFGEFMRAGAA